VGVSDGCCGGPGGLQRAALANGQASCSLIVIMGPRAVTHVRRRR
jgi:hypothetical protein